MWRFFTLGYQKAGWVLAVFLLLAVLGGWQARTLQMRVSASDLVPPDSPMRIQSDVVKEKFHSGELALIYAEDEELFTAQKLHALKRLNVRLLSMPAIKRVDSIFTVKNIRSDGGFINTAPLLGTIPDDPQELAQIKTEAISNPLLRKNIIAPNGQALLFTLHLHDPADFVLYQGDIPKLFQQYAIGDIALVPAEKAVGRPTVSDSEFKAALYAQLETILRGSDQLKAIAQTLTENTGNSLEAIAADPRAIITAERQAKFAPLSTALRSGHTQDYLYGYTQHFDRLFQIGAPAVQVWMTDYILSDQRILLPLAGLVLIGLIGLILRSIHAAIVPLLNAVVTVAICAGVMAYFGIPVNMLNYIVPVLILIIGATEDVHILVEYRDELQKGLPPLDALKTAGRTIGLTILLTSITTICGFAVNGLNEILILQHFGITAAAAMFVRFLCSLLLLPAYLRIFGQSLQKTTTPTVEKSYGGRYANLLKVRLMSNPAVYIALFAMIALPALYLSREIQFSNDLIAFLKKDSPIVKKLDIVQGKLAGSKVINVTLYGEEGDFRQPEQLQQLASLTQYLQSIQGVDTVVSLSDYLSLVNQAMTDGGDGKYIVPNSERLIAQYLLFFHYSDLEPYMSGDYAEANIVIRTHISDSQAINELVQGVRESIDTGRFGNWRYSVTGESVTIASGVKELARGQVLSLGFMVGFLFIIVGGLFISLRCASLTVLSNLFPVVVVFGLMGLFDIPLNVGTCMVAAITIGIAVDDTLHLMVRYNRDLKKFKNEHRAIVQSVTDEFKPVSITSLALAGGFLVLTFSSFQPVAQFGMLSAVVIVLALIADLALTPILLSTTQLVTLWDIMGLQVRQRLLERSQLFQGMNPWQAKKLILACDIREVKAGDVVIREGEEGESMYVILDGRMEVFKVSSDGENIPVTTLDIGEAIGEIAVIARSKRTANVMAVENSKLLEINWDALLRMQRFAPYLASRLFLNLATVLGKRLISQTDKLHGGSSPNLK